MRIGRNSQVFVSFNHQTDNAKIHLTKLINDLWVNSFYYEYICVLKKKKKKNTSQ